MTEPTRPSFGAAMRNRTVQIMLGTSFLIAAASASALAMQSGTAAIGDMDRSQIEQIVRDYILNHPEILPEAMERLKAKESGEKVAAIRSDLEKPYHGAWEGAADGDVVIVEFFDYACGYCRSSMPDIAAVLRADKRVKIVYRELPILSPLSMEAARVSMLAARRGKYSVFHASLFNAGRVSRDSIFVAALVAGIDRKTAETVMADKSMDGEIDANIEMAQHLGASGTPTFVVGNEVLNGAVGDTALLQAVARARAAR